MERGFTQGKLAGMCGLPHNAIAKYETEVIIPSIETLKKLAEALEVSMDYFVFDHAKMEGVPKIHDPALYNRYFILESLDTAERGAVLTVLDALIASHKLKELTATLPKDKPQNGKKQNKHAAT